MFFILTEEVKGFTFSLIFEIRMHVRRTDKILAKESEFIPSTVFIRRLKAVMDAKRRNGNQWTSHMNERTKVYIASEDGKVLPEFGRKFKDWDFVGYNNTGGPSLGTEKSRHSQLFGIIRDIWILFNCDYVIGTFSSNVGFAYFVQIENISFYGALTLTYFYLL